MDQYGKNFRAPKVDVHQFSMIPQASIPRSTFRMQQQHKTTINASLLIPVFCHEILPGDTVNLSMTAFCRLATPLYPIMDNMDIESWFFFVPCRIVWNHWVNFNGEQPASPADSISYVIPQCVSPAGGFVAGSTMDYFGIPTAGQITGSNTISVNALPLRAYNMIVNNWFRDENLDTALGYGATNTVYDIGDGPDPYTNYYSPFTIRKRHDYFTSCLPWTQKGGVAVTLPLGGQATVKTATSALVSGVQQAASFVPADGTTAGAGPYTLGLSASPATQITSYSTAPGTIVKSLYPSNLYADLSTATGATINALRLAVQTQKLLERDARGGTRYQEMIMAHFGVHPLDARLQRPEYLGGGKSPVNIAPVPQTSGTGATGTTAPLGQLAAVGTAVARQHGFRGSFTEHGYVIGLIAVRADPIYQQGLHRMWTRSTRYDFYLPVFAGLGEQSVRNDEIYCTGTATDAQTFGYQERWAEYRYKPSIITGLFRSTYTQPLDAWHLAQKYTALPALNSTFIADATTNTLTRNLAAGAAANDEQFLCDFFFDMKTARPMPMYGVPGGMDRF